MAGARPRLAVLISGQGRNLQAILDAVRDGRIAADIAGVISNRAEAGGLERARDAGVPAVVVPHTAYPTREAFDAALAAELARLRPDFVALAGFMRILGGKLIARHEGRMLNIHPSLLPKYRGLGTHAQVVANRDTEHGASVHYVTGELDGGPVAIQGRFSVSPQDTAQVLAERVMNDIELKIFPQALAWVARGELRCEGGRVRLRGATLLRPLGLADLEPEFR